MAIKDLLVAYHGDESSQNALRFALQMGSKYDAMVTGAHVVADSRPGAQAGRWIPENVREMIQNAEREAAETVENQFREAVAATDPDRPHDWVRREGHPSLSLARMSRFYDMLIVGQFTTAIRSGGQALQPDELIQRSGKPMLIVPETYPVRPFREVAVVAWDGSRSAARALADAMQVLETKRKLYVVTVQRRSQRMAPLTDFDIVKHLERHGIDAELVSLESRAGAGEALNAFCAEVDPDVLVMGAFGRAKIGALFFGSVTRHVLEHQTVPILMSH